jgi:hypothetical protein
MCITDQNAGKSSFVGTAQNLAISAVSAGLLLSGQLLLNQSPVMMRTAMKLLARSLGLQLFDNLKFTDVKYMQ